MMRRPLWEALEEDGRTRLFQHTFDPRYSIVDGGGGLVDVRSGSTLFDNRPTDAPKHSLVDAKTESASDFDQKLTEINSTATSSTKKHKGDATDSSDTIAATHVNPPLGMSNNKENARGSVKDIWIIGNHADELTPWIPVMCELSSVNFVAIPCCFYNFEGKKNDFNNSIPHPPSTNHANMTTGRYRSYVEYVANISLALGIHVEFEWLRIPSTKNLALIGRRRDGETTQIERAQLCAQYRSQFFRPRKSKNTKASQEQRMDKDFESGVQVDGGRCERNENEEWIDWEGMPTDDALCFYSE